VQLYHGDCREVAEAWTSAAVLLVDPPYGIDYNSGSRRDTLASSIVGDKDTTVRDDLLRLWGDRPALVFGSWRVPRPAGVQARLIWDTKGALGMGDLSIPWKPSDQEIYVLGHGSAGRFAGPRTSNVLRYAPVQSMARNGRLHPHEKPVSLLVELLRKCPPGMVADPCAGSGSLGVAARLAGRPAVLVERREADCEQIARRLDQGVLDLGAPA
jgi:site-specific DNA-methyltransferase (adenine-specific)